MGYPPPPFINGSHGHADSFMPYPFFQSVAQHAPGNGVNGNTNGMWGAPFSRNESATGGAFPRPTGSAVPPFAFGGLSNASANSYVQKDG